MSNRTFRKIYTRDNGLIVQDSWYYAFTKGWEKLTGEKNPFLPPLIYYVNDGATEIWEDDESIGWYQNTVLEKNQVGANFFNQSLRDYQAIVSKMEAYRVKASLSLVELKELVGYLFNASALFTILYYSAYNSQTPAEIRTRALSWREKDEFYDIYERKIKNSIAYLWPESKGLELVVTRADPENFPSLDVLSLRMKHSVFIPGENIEVIALPDFLVEHPDYHFVFDKIDDHFTAEGVLRGSSATRGQAKGRVRILRRKIQVSELKKGEILVSPMTTPDFVLAMKRAAAIVTDEGGITCHAAIVSRELKKPCIVGTQVATKVLKDGDLVEVDADRGVVRKI